MKYLIALLISLSISLESLATQYNGYEYNFLERANQKIHIAKINLNFFNISIISGHNSVFGRESLQDIALRENATIAVNGGFFQIGGNEDGRPTGTLIVNGELFGLRTSNHAVFKIHNNIPSVGIWRPKVELIIGKQHFQPKSFNKFLKNSEIILYSKKWGDYSLTPYNKRNEIQISSSMIVNEIIPHGNNSIPQNGYVLSLPKDIDISSIKEKDQVSININEHDILNPGTSAVMGIPFLIIDGKINPDLTDTKKHARSSIAIDKDGNIIIVVVEHAYSKFTDSLSLKNVQNMAEHKPSDIASISIGDIKNLLTKELADNNLAEGMTLLELAQFMESLGAVSAINLDGGGSSALYIENKYVNNAISDNDEELGIAKIRPVSDAIVFIKK